MIQDFIKDMVKYSPAQIVPGIVGFLSIPVITRLFSPQDYGNYSLTIATVMVLTTLLGWLPMSIIRFYPAYETEKRLDIFYGNVIKLETLSILIVTAIFGLMLFFAKAYFSPELYSLMYVGFGVFIVIAIFDVFQYLLMAQRQIILYSGFAVWKSIGSLGIALLLIFFLRRGVESLLWGVILSISIILPLLWKTTIKGASTLYFKIDSFLAKEMAKYSFPLVVGNLAAWILSLSDRYILEFFRGSQEVGIYSASYNVSEKSVMLIVTLFMLASGPMAMHIWEKEGSAKSKEFLNKITRYYLITCVPVVVGLSVLAKPLIGILTGQEYFMGYKIIPFVTSGVLFLGLQQQFQMGFLYHKKTGFIAWAIVVSGLLNLILNFLFIPKHGYMGAAVTTLISYTFLLFFIVIGSRRIFVWKFPFKSLANVSCASAIMGIVVYYVGNSLTSSVSINLISAICVGMAVYIIMLLLLKEFSQEEIQIFDLLKENILK